MQIDSSLKQMLSMRSSSMSFAWSQIKTIQFLWDGPNKMQQSLGSSSSYGAQDQMNQIVVKSKKPHLYISGYKYEWKQKHLYNCKSSRNNPFWGVIGNSMNMEE